MNPDASEELCLSTHERNNIGSLFSRMGVPEHNHTPLPKEHVLTLGLGQLGRVVNTLGSYTPIMAMFRVVWTLISSFRKRRNRKSFGNQTYFDDFELPRHYIAHNLYANQNVMQGAQAHHRGNQMRSEMQHREVV
eukprot:GHVN01077092.1.p1 GENE.GHVN01077092.1~~GHVN01077092.1.p1  ORF type:complete len:135 (-),score=4.21 GHVN01077092.1:239-643(-)